MFQGGLNRTVFMPSAAQYGLSTAGTEFFGV